jgi:hypothetical protein
MGIFNSSVTRVWPVFDTLFAADSVGTYWLLPLLQAGHLFSHSSLYPLNDVGSILPQLCEFDLPISGELAKVMGPDRLQVLPMLRNAYECDIAPPQAFLRWLLENPNALSWPKQNQAEEKIYGDRTQQCRKSLLAGDRKIQAEALREFDLKGVAESKGKWWAFEGFTSVDCLLETERLVVFVEGKRTEAISKSTDWFPKRNQVIRNLEAAKERAGSSKEYAVLLCAEKRLEIPESAWSDSLPHYSPAEIADLRKHYLGCALWGEIRDKLSPSLKLPDTLDEAIAHCAALRAKEKRA